MKKSREQLIQQLTSAAAWLRAAYTDAIDSGEAEMAGHAKVAQMSVAAALGALSKKAQVAS